MAHATNIHHRRGPALTKALPTALLAALLAACGGGGGGSSTTAGVGSGGTGSFTVGTISGFGSVIINGIRYDDSSASIRTEDDDSSDDDKGTLGSDDLRLGMIAEVEGTVQAAAAGSTFTPGIARVIRYSRELKGPVSRNGSDNSSFKLFNQLVVKVSPSTYVFGLGGNASVTLAIDGNACPHAEVYAFLDTTGSSPVYNATRVECKTTAPNSYRIYGPVSNINTVSNTFDINGVTINYLTAPDVPALSNGTSVRARLSTAPIGTTWTATRVRSATARTVANGLEAKVEGLVTEADSTAKTFKVNGIAVSYSDSTVIEGNVTPTNGARVEVEGSSNNGVLVARKIEFEDGVQSGSTEDNISRGTEAVGTVSNLSGSGQTGGSFTLTTSGGRTFRVTFESADLPDAADRTNLRAGLTVEVRGQVGGTDAAPTLDASRVKIDD